MVKKIVSILIREASLLFQSPQIFFIRWFDCFLLNSVFGIKRDFFYRYNNHIKIKFPNRIGVSYVLMETFVYKIFSKMEGLDNVLDIGGFIGESAIYLSDHNKKIECYELSKANFDYLQENCKHKKNINYHHAGVSSSDADYIEYDETLGVDSTTPTASSTSQHMIKTKNINMIELLKKKHFDGFKLDIEGGEYEILQSIIDNKLFNFKKGIIEFHRLDHKNNLHYLRGFIDYLLKKGYIYTLITNENKQLQLSDLHSLVFCNIYFELN